MSTCELFAGAQQDIIK